MMTSTIRLFLFLFFGILLLPAFAGNETSVPEGNDSTNTEFWRNLGYQARLNDLFDSSLYYYNKVLDISPNDYDALLATARLYYRFWNLPMALKRYGSIYEADSSDVEALTGMGLSYHRQGEYDLSVSYLDKALRYLPGHIPALFGKARSLGFDGKMKEAIPVYEQILAIDDTWAEAWEGKGKMLYWLNRPVSALPCYARALELDPGNPDYEKGVKRMKNLTAWTPAFSFRQVMEDEEVYRVVANINQISLSKRVSDHFGFNVGTMLDISNKTFLYDSLFGRRFDNTWISTNLFFGNHTLTANVGYSRSDSIFSAYGLSWTYGFRIGKVRFWNSLGLSYDYFYYWNKVSRDYVHDNLSITFKTWNLQSKVLWGEVRTAAVYSDSGFVDIKNPFMIVRTSLIKEVIKKPSVSVVLTHEWRNYDKRSPLYWSPYKRSMISPGIKISHTWKDLYMSGVFNAGMDNYDIGNVDGSAELGYTLNKWSFGTGYSGFYNKYYKNRVLYFVVKARL